MLIFILAEGNQLGLAGDKFNLVIITVLDGEEKEVVKVIDIVGEENRIIGKRNAGDGVNSVGDSKHGELGGSGLLIVGKFILVGRRNSTLLQTSGIGDWTLSVG